jgi:uroporphyrinogen decarboxylase
MTLLRYFGSLDRVGVVPILGYAGLKIDGLTSEECLLNPRLHANLVRTNLQHFHPDAVLPLLDLTVEAESYGVQPVFNNNEAPRIERHLSLERAAHLEPSETQTDRMSIMIETARLISKETKDVPKGFFVTGPFTLAGQIVGILDLMKGISFSEPTISPLLERSTQTIVNYSRYLEAAGVDFLVIADPTSSLISPKQFSEFAEVPIRKIVKSFSKDVILHICGRSGHLLRQMVDTGVAAISIDQNIKLVDAVKTVPNNILIFGNYSPTNFMLEKPETIRAHVETMLSEVSEAENVVASTGCDIPSSCPAENIEAFIQTVKTFKKLRR